ncbi:MAG: TIGR00268 family protein [Bacteroidetes bacterium]|nr:MAG: TIGR00268 family protein [Bacteroidota bacterium]
MEGRAHKKRALLDWLASRKGCIVAFSGGIDSSFLLYMARKALGRDRVLAVLARSESLKTRDYDFARAFCRRYDVVLKVVYTRELDDERYSSNPVDRCYVCRGHLYRALNELKQGYPGFDVLNGTNADDLSDYRPGNRAAADFQVFSPLVDCGITKAELREMAQAAALPNYDMPASPCMSTRIPYHQVVTREKLAQIEAAEASLNRMGFRDVRVRHYGKMARVEVEKAMLGRLKELEPGVREAIARLGFDRVEIDEEGLVSGKMNRKMEKEDGKGIVL